jgi:hypothetical protein
VDDNPFEKACRSLARVFAQKSENRGPWDEALRVWNVVRSTHVLEWQAQAKTVQLGDSVLRLLELRFGAIPPEPLTEVHTTRDMSVLQSWFDAVVRAGTLDEFRTAVHDGIA